MHPAHAGGLHFCIMQHAHGISLQNHVWISSWGTCIPLSGSDLLIRYQFFTCVKRLRPNPTCHHGTAAVKRSKRCSNATVSPGSRRVRGLAASCSAELHVSDGSISIYIC
jgi:hypothetical protein